MSPNARLSTLIWEFPDLLFIYLFASFHVFVQCREARKGFYKDNGSFYVILIFKIKKNERIEGCDCKR